MTGPSPQASRLGLGLTRSLLLIFDGSAPLPPQHVLSHLSHLPFRGPRRRALNPEPSISSQAGTGF